MERLINSRSYDSIRKTQKRNFSSVILKKWRITDNQHGFQIDSGADSARSASLNLEYVYSESRHGRMEFTIEFLKGNLRAKGTEGIPQGKKEKCNDDNSMK